MFVMEPNLIFQLQFQKILPISDTLNFVNLHFETLSDLVFSLLAQILESVNIIA